MKKFLAIFLATIMALAVIPAFAFAEETPADTATDEDIVAAWDANYTLFLDYIFDDDEFLANNYVAANVETLKNTATTLEIAALTDANWIDSISGNASIENAEGLLCALIEKVNVEYNNEVVADILAVLETATDVYDFAQKVGKYSEDIAAATDSVSDIFAGINIAIKIGNAWESEKAELIEAYSRILSVQAANAQYITMLEYVAANTDYAELVAACNNLVADFKLTEEEAAAQVQAAAAADMGAFGAEWALQIAANSNVYTAAILKAYNIGGDVADFLWNTSDKYELIDALITIYYLNSTIADWAAEAYAGEDAEAAVYAVNVLIGARTLGEEALYNYKRNEAGGFVGKVKEKLQATVFEEYAVALLKLDVIRETFFETDIATYVPVKAGIVVFCPVDIQLIDVATPVYTLYDGNVGTFRTDSGIYAASYCPESQDYVKIAYLYDTYTVKMTGTATGYVTFVADILGTDGEFEDWSFTDEAVAAGTIIAVSTKASDAPVYMCNDAGVKETKALNDEFVYSENPQPTVEDIGEAVVDVTKGEAKSFIEKIREFFQNLFASLFSIFKK